MIYFVVMVLKAVAWIVAFISGVGCDLKGMLLRAGGIALLLTLADKVSVASNLGGQAILLTLALYAAMAFTLLPLAWKVKKPALTITLNFFGALGAFAAVNFVMDFLRGVLS